MNQTRLTCPRVEVGLGLRREFQSVLDWAEKAGCYVNYVKIPAFLQNVYIDLVIEGDSRYTVPIRNWMKQLEEV